MSVFSIIDPKAAKLDDEAEAAAAEERALARKLAEAKLQAADPVPHPALAAQNNYALSKIGVPPEPEKPLPPMPVLRDPGLTKFEPIVAPAMPPPPPRAKGPAPIRMEAMDVEGKLPEAPKPAEKLAEAPAAPAAPAKEEPLKDDEMGAAEAEAKRRRLWGIIPAILSGFSSRGPELLKAVDKAADSPITDLLARREELRKKAEDREKDEARQKRLALDDPNSAQSQMATKLAMSNGLISPADGPITANMWDMMSKGASFKQARENHEAQVALQRDQLASQERNQSLNRAQQLQLARENNAAELKRQGLKMGTEGAVVDKKTQGLLNEVSDRHANIKRELGNLRRMVKDDGTWEMVGPHNATLDQKLTAIATDYAKLSDPESIARPGEVEQAKKMLFEVGLGTKNSTADQILQNFEGMVDDRLKTAYQVRGVQAPNAPASAASGAPRKQYSPSRNQTRIIYPDGRVEVVDGRA